MLLSIYIGILMLFGLAALFFPRAIQRHAVRSVSQGLTGKMKGLRTFVESNAYIWNVRFAGLLAITIAGFMAWAHWSL
jgi:hypothetical protein